MAFLFNPFLKKFSSMRSNTCSTFVIISLVHKIKCVLRLHIWHIGRQQLAGYNEKRPRIRPVSTIFSRNTPWYYQPLAQKYCGSATIQFLMTSWDVGTCATTFSSSFSRMISKTSRELDFTNYSVIVCVFFFFSPSIVNFIGCLRERFSNLGKSQIWHQLDRNVPSLLWVFPCRFQPLY